MTKKSYRSTFSIAKTQTVVYQIVLEIALMSSTHSLDWQHFLYSILKSMIWSLSIPLMLSRKHAFKNILSKKCKSDALSLSCILLFVYFICMNNHGVRLMIFPGLLPLYQDHRYYLILVHRLRLRLYPFPPCLLPCRGTHPCRPCLENLAFVRGQSHLGPYLLPLSPRPSQPT